MALLGEGESGGTDRQWGLMGARARLLIVVGCLWGKKIVLDGSACGFPRPKEKSES